MSKLEQKIASAICTDTITSTKLGQLIAETEATIAQADADVIEIRKQALDPIAMPDANAARTALEDAEFLCTRLKNLLPKLQQRYQKVLAREEYEAWLPRFEAAKTRQDALAEKLLALYQPFVEQIVPLLLEIEQADAEARRANDAKPAVGYGDGRNLRAVELQARGLERFALNGLSIMKDLKLPSWEPANQPAWPPYCPLDLAMVTPVVGGDPRLHSSRWYEVWEEEQQKRARTATE